jgi:hypothetical protein
VSGHQLDRPAAGGHPLLFDVVDAEFDLGLQQVLAETLMSQGGTQRVAACIDAGHGLPGQTDRPPELA